MRLDRIVPRALLACLAALLVWAAAGCSHITAPAQATAERQPSAGAERRPVQTVRDTPQGRSAPSEQELLSFVDGNVEFLLLHEIAHLLITEKAFPIVGPTENAADYIATWALLNEKPFDPAQQDRPLRFLLSAASAFAVAWRSALDSGVNMPYWGDHALSIQHYYQIACLLYGSNPQTFARIPDISGLPASRAQDCVGEYQRTDAAIRWLIKTYGRKPGDPPPPPTPVVYEEPRTLVSAHVVAQLKSLQLLERTVERLNERFALERPFSLVVRSCGRPEAAWMPDRSELVICYELVDYIYSLALNEQAGTLSPLLPRS
jgi:hypothetical protein